MTDTPEMQGNWKEQKGKLKERFAVLTDNDLMLADGNNEETLGRIQIVLGKSKEELEKIITSL
jgi:uncharacterized protein YjbJ (UPF0337 family)